MKRELLIFAILLFLSVTGASAVFFGNLHAHTAYSDGQGDPYQAFQYARNVAHLDFQAITDHAHYFNQLLDDGSDKFSKTREYANALTDPGSFVALAGFEWTATGYGHINVYDTDEWIDRYKADLFELYDWIVEHKALAQFNHPVRDFGDNFREFLYFPKVDVYINLIEVGNGNWSSGDIINDEMESAYREALKKGWHVGATANQDNHKPNWGTANDARTAVIVDELSRSSIMKALRARHVYATEDKNALVSFSTGDAMMGDVLYDATSVTLEFSFEDPGDPSSCATLVTSRGEIPIPVSGDRWSYATDLRVKYNYEWAYLKVLEKDGDDIITSPIWFQSSSKHYALNPWIFPQKPVKGEKFTLKLDLINWNEKPGSIDLTVKVRGREIFDRTIEMEPISRLSTSVELFSNESGTLEIYTDGELAWSMPLNLAEFSAVLDMTHDNGYDFESSKLTKWLETIGGSLGALRGRMNTRSLAGKHLLIVPLPESGGFAPVIKKLNTREIRMITEYVDSGGILMLITTREPSERDVVNTYNQLLERFNIGAIFSDDGTKILKDENEIDLMDAPSGQGHVLIVSYKVAQNITEALKETLEKLLGVGATDGEK